MAKFEKVKRFEGDETFNLPSRKTANSAGYDFEVAEDIIVPPYKWNSGQMNSNLSKLTKKPTLVDIARFTKECNARPTLVPTGVKCKLDEGTYLEMSLRSSTPLKYWFIMANSVGIIDADYYGNPENDGEIFVPVINLGQTDVHLKKGDIIAQGIIHKFEITEDDTAEGERTGGFGSTSKIG